MTRPLLSLLVLAVAACAGEAPTEPAADLPFGLDRAAAPGGTVHQVRGSGHIETTGKRVFAFAAVEHADGSVSGQFTLNIKQPVLGSENPSITRIQAEVTCMSVAGNRAWVGGVVKSASNPAWVGGETAWAVEDGGEGKNAVDRLTLMNVPTTPGFAQAYCDAMGTVPNLQVLGGNIQVR